LNIPIVVQEPKKDELLELFKQELNKIDVPEFIALKWSIKHYAMPTEIGIEIIPNSLANIEWSKHNSFAADAKPEFDNTDPNKTIAIRVSTRFYKNRIAVRHINYTIKYDKEDESLWTIEQKRLHYYLHHANSQSAVSYIASEIVNFLLAKSL